jgi:RNA polymerase sigma factor (TIGR02999 family)
MLDAQLTYKGTEMAPIPPEAGPPESNKQLFAALYSELKALAERQLKRNQGVPLSATTLLHEAYLGMSAREAEFPDRQRFMGYAARVMRGLIIDFVRKRRALKRGGEFHITQLPTEVGEAIPDERELVTLSEAIDELSSRDARLAELVDLRYFCGYSFKEIGALQGISERTANRDWERARTLLYRRLRDPG